MACRPRPRRRNKRRGGAVVSRARRNRPGRGRGRRGGGLRRLCAGREDGRTAGHPRQRGRPHFDRCVCRSPRFGMGSRCARQCRGNPQLRKGGDARGDPPARGAHHQYCIRFRYARRRLARQHHLRRHQGERRGIDHGIGARARPARHYGQCGGAGRRRHGNDPCGADG
jgi:hypothetical protein